MRRRAARPGAALQRNAYALTRTSRAGAETLLIAPTQRLARQLLFLKRLRGATDARHVDAAALARAEKRWLATLDACDAVAGVSTLTVADRPPGRRFDAPSETDASGDAARAAGAAAARRRTEAFVERVLVRMRQCPFTGSKSRAAVGLEEFGVDAAPILYGYSAAGDVAGLLADVWAVLDGFRRAGPGGYSSILVACPAFDGDFERWTREIFPALEATLLAAEASRELGIVCFHPDYATPDPKWLATHRFGHMYAPPTLRRWLEDADADLAGALDDDDLQYLGSYMRRTPVATINVLWSAQLEAAERKRESKALYARNLRPVSYTHLTLPTKA